MNIDSSIELFNKAKKIMPGGVNSPVRAFKSVGGSPIFMKKAQGAFLFDQDGNSYIDMINSWGPMILGHAHPVVISAAEEAIKDSFSFGTPSEREVEMAELVCQMVPSIEMVRMVNSGTEATMAAIRVARGFTHREKIIKFEGCYHGHGDAFLIAAGSGAMTHGVPDSPGVPKSIADHTLTAPYNDLEAVQNLINYNEGQIAAIIVEPVVGNMGCVLPDEGFLSGLRKICTEQGIVLIFDEVMTGFRLSAGGAQQLYNVLPDLTTLGKIIGGGMPVGAYGGKKAIMEMVSPAGPVYQAGTLSGNPVAMACGIAMLKMLNETPTIYSNLAAVTESIVAGMKQINGEMGHDYTINQVGSMYSMFFTHQKVQNFITAKTSDTALFGKYFHQMLANGVYLAPSQFETLFVSNCIDNTLIDRILTAHKASLISALSH